MTDRIPTSDLADLAELLVIERKSFIANLEDLIARKKRIPAHLDESLRRLPILTELARRLRAAADREAGTERNEKAPA